MLYNKIQYKGLAPHVNQLFIGLWDALSYKDQCSLKESRQSRQRLRVSVLSIFTITSQYLAIEDATLFNKMSV